MKPEERVPLRAIAEKTGVTRMAVSLALRGKPGVSDATRKKILKVAKQMGYEPDPEVAKLLSHIRARAPMATTSCLALLTSGTSADEWTHYTAEKQYVEGVRTRASTYGYRVEEFWLDQPGISPARLSNIMWNRGIEGVLIAPLQGKLSPKKSRSISLDFHLFSAVEISETIESPELDRALHDQYTATLKALHALTNLGYRRPGLVLEEALDLRVNGKWTAAYLQHGLRMGRKIPPLIMPTRHIPAFNRWLTRYQPDVLISVDAWGLRLAQEQGLSIPKDIGYCSLDVDGDTQIHPNVSGINQNSRQLGAAAVDLVVGAIQRGHRGIPAHPVHLQVEGVWVPGQTLTRQR